MPLLTYRVTTLGCRVNHAETREICSMLLVRGLIPACDCDSADIEILHTCSVTNTAAAKSRAALRRALRRRSNSNTLAEHGTISHQSASDGRQTKSMPATNSDHINPQVFVTGCYASTNTGEASRLVGRNRVIPQDEDDGNPMIERLARRLDQWLAALDGHPSIRSAPETSSTINKEEKYVSKTISNRVSLPVVKPMSGSGRHVRAELKIQDGCDAYCTFCIIPKIRRTLRSKTIADAVTEAKMLVDLGHKEIVLSGVFISAFGHETALRRKQRHRDAHPLADLLDAVAQVSGLERLRISSMEPGDMSEPLLDAMIANIPVVVPHLHLPLQSGSDAILIKMNRQYSLGDYLDMIDMVNTTLTTSDDLPPAITTDIICGFPGESHDDFQRTVQIARRVGFLHMHVFPFSPKKGTAAARWSDQFIPASIVKQRVQRLLELENDPLDGLSIRFRRRLKNRTVRVILEQHDRENPSLMTGRCDHYALIHVPTKRPRGTLLIVRIIDVTPSHTFSSGIEETIQLPVLQPS